LFPGPSNDRPRSKRRILAGRLREVGAGVDRRQARRLAQPAQDRAHEEAAGDEASGDVVAEVVETDVLEVESISQLAKPLGEALQAIVTRVPPS
jgi:hypothetical protein